MKIDSRNFKSCELKCKCKDPYCIRYGADLDLFLLLEELRSIFDKPIKINSAYRCLKHNRDIGSKDTSQHIKGTAADIVIKGISIKKVQQILKEKYWGKDKLITGLGLYKTFTHVDVREGNPAFWDNR